MFGDSEEDEKVRNFIMFKFYGTNREMEEAGPFIVVCGIIALAIFLLICWFA